MRLLLSHLTGSQNSRQAARAFLEAGWLAEMHHTLAWTHLPAWAACLPATIKTQFQGRLFDADFAPHLRPHPLPEWGRLLAARTSLPLLSPLLRRVFSIRACNRRFDRAVARHLRRNSRQFDAVYGYFDTSLHQFREAKRRGLRRIYELPTPYWRMVNRLVQAEAVRRPDWADTLPSRSSLAEAASQRDEELQLADLVIVPSPLVRDSLAEAPPFNAPVVVVPYGCPTPASSISDLPSPISHLPSSAATPPLRLLFAGTLSQSKGLADLLEAIAPLGNRVQLSLAGSPPAGLPISHLPSSICHPSSSIHFLGQLPRGELLAEMRRHDLLVLPTLYEGLSLVLLEAMSQGLPVLTTTHSGLQGLVENGRHARLIQPADPAGLREALEHLLNNPDELASLAANARLWAAANSWADYRQNLRRALSAAPDTSNRPRDAF